MVLVKVLKRRDAASVLVAILVAMVLSPLLMAWTGHLAGVLSGLQNGQYMGYAAPGSGWKVEYLNPFVLVVLELLLLEVLIRLYVLVASIFKK